MWSNETLDRFQKKLPIDPYNLHQDCAEHPALCGELAELLSEARAEMKQAQVTLQVTQAEVALEIRKCPDVQAAYGVPKITEPTVDQLVAVDERVRQANSDLLVLSDRYQAISSLFSAYETRGSLLKAEVQLVCSRYFSEAQTSGRMLDSIEEEIAEARRGGHD
jgi:hypothetical protein